MTFFIILNMLKNIIFYIIYTNFVFCHLYKKKSGKSSFNWYCHKRKNKQWFRYSLYYNCKIIINNENFLEATYSTYLKYHQICNINSKNNNLKLCVNNKRCILFNKFNEKNVSKTWNNKKYSNQKIGIIEKWEKSVITGIEELENINNKI